MNSFARYLIFLLLLPGINIPVHALVLPGTGVMRSFPAEPDPAVVRAALHAFAALPKKEKRMRAKQVKQVIREFRHEVKAGHRPSLSKFWLSVIAILLPPLAIWLFEGEIRKCFWISILLTLIFWIPGVIYALVIIHKDWKKYH